MYQKPLYNTLFLFVFLPIGLFAQTINLDLPSCYHLQYILALKYGNKQDTVAIGRFDEKGRATFSIPDEYSTFRGVGSLSVPTTTKKWNIILNSEEKISLEEIPNTDDISFSESKENIALENMMARQREIIEDYNRQGKFGLFFSSLAAKKKYEDFNIEIKESPLYAARMMELLNALSGLGSEPNMLQEEALEEQRLFIVDQLNFKDLYTSGFWQLAMDTWLQTVLNDDSLLVADSKKMLDRTEDIIIRRELTQSIIQLFSKYGKDNLLMELGSEYLIIPINGKPAPQLVTGGLPIEPKHSLIIFYDSDCGFCRNELQQFKEKYALLSNEHNQMRVISVSGDTDKVIYEELAETFPWKDKLCDYKGFAGENFANYGIVGSPTIILIDKEGIVRGRYARLNEFLKE